jgi:hypothetical protein
MVTKILSSEEKEVYPARVAGSWIVALKVSGVPLRDSSFPELQAAVIKARPASSMFLFIFMFFLF